MSYEQEVDSIKNKSLVVFEPAKIVNVPSPAIHIENNISLIQKKLWFEMVYFAFPKMGTQRRYTITLKMLKELLGWSNTTSSDDKLKEALHGLSQVAVSWNIFGKDKKHVWESFPLLSGCRIPEYSGQCIFEFSSFLEERFLSMGEEAYVKIDLIISKKFQSKYALSIYCLALDFLILEIGYSEKKFTLEELRKYLALKDDEYKLTADFNKRIIVPSQEEINKTSDMNIEIKPFKEGKKIAGYKLCMSLKEGRVKEYLERKNQVKQLINSKMLEQDQKAIKTVITIQDEKLKKFFAKYNISITVDKIQSKLKNIEKILGSDKLENYLSFLSTYADSEYAKGRIKNFPGFFVKLLTDDTQFDNYLFHLEKEKEKEERDRKRIDNMIETELKNRYESFLNKDFKDYIVNNIDTLEEKFIAIITDTLKPGSFEYDIAVAKMNQGIVDKSLIIGAKQSVQATILNHVSKYKDKLDYKPISFKEWKIKTVNNEYINDLRNNLKNTTL